MLLVKMKNVSFYGKNHTDVLANPIQQSKICTGNTHTHTPAHIKVCKKTPNWSKLRVWGKKW